MSVKFNAAFAVLKAQESVKKIIEENGLRSMNKKTLQQWLETNLAKVSKEAFVASKMFFCEEHKAAVKQICEDNQIDFNLAVKAISKIAIHRRVSMQMFFNMMKNKFNSLKELQLFLEKMLEVNFLQKDKGGMIIPHKDFQIKEEQEEFMEFFQSNPPMIVEPNKAYINKRGRIRNGYLNINRGVFSREAIEHSEVPLDFINVQNSNHYLINYRVWEFIKNFPKLREIDNNSSEEDIKKFKADVLHHMKKIFIVEFFKELGIEDLWILNFFDYRGRNYPVGYLFNPQGQDADKALLSFRAMPINQRGVQWLKISIANCFNCEYEGKDLDKHIYPKRLEWYEKNIPSKLEMGYEEFIEWLNSAALHADSPACFWAQMENMWWIQHDLKEGKTPQSWCITHWDATASGYQLQSVFAKDFKMAKLTNLNGKDRNDPYTGLTIMGSALGLPKIYGRTFLKKKVYIPLIYGSINCIKEAFENPDHQEIIYKVLGQFPLWEMSQKFVGLWDKTVLEYSWYLPDGFKVYKKNLVSIVRTFTYEGKEIALHWQSNEPVERSRELGPNITHSCDGFFARELERRMNWNLKWKTWVKKLYLEYCVAGDSWEVDESHSSRELMKKLLKLGEQFQFYSMRILREVTSQNIDLIPKELFERLWSELPEEPCEIQEIHDSFGVHPNHVSALIGQYKMLLRDLALSRFLPAVIEQYRKDDPEVNKWVNAFTYETNKEQLAKEIMKSVYPLC